MIAFRRAAPLGLLAVAFVAVAACGGGGSSIPPTTASGGAKTKAPQTVSIKIVVPAAPKTATAAIRRRMQIAEGTTGIAFAVYTHPLASNPTPVATPAFDISSGSANCTANADNSRTCTLALQLPATTYDINVTTYDAAPVSGVIPGAAHALGYQAFVAYNVSVGQANALNLSINGIAAGGAIMLPVSSVRALDALTQNATVAVLDADSNVILSNSYVDTNGNPVSVAMSDANSTGLVTFSPASFSAPQTGGVSVVYSPANITGAQMAGSATAAITATLSSGPAASAALNIPAPLNLLTTLSAAPTGLGVDTSATQLLVTFSSAQKYQSIGTTGASSGPLPLASSGPIGPTPGPQDITVAPNGNITMTFSSTTALGYIVGYEQAISLSNSGNGLVSDGTNLWVAEPTINKIAMISSFNSPPPVVTEASTTAGATPTKIAIGSDGRAWYTEPGINAIGAASSGPSALVDFTSGISPSAGLLGICEGADGNIWFAETTTGKIGRITPTGSVTEFSAGVAQPLYVVAGPDGNVWFDYVAPAPGIGRVTPAGIVSTFPLPAGIAPGEMASLSGLIWFIDTSHNGLFSIQP